jgi:hypothetical protein
MMAEYNLSLVSTMNVNVPAAPLPEQVEITETFSLDEFLLFSSEDNVEGPQNGFSAIELEEVSDPQTLLGNNACSTPCTALPALGLDIYTSSPSLNDINMEMNLVSDVCSVVDPSIPTSSVLSQPLPSSEYFSGYVACLNDFSILSQSGYQQWPSVEGPIAPNTSFQQDQVAKIGKHGTCLPQTTQYSKEIDIIGTSDSSSLIRTGMEAAEMHNWAIQESPQYSREPLPYHRSDLDARIHPRNPNKIVKAKKPAQFIYMSFSKTTGEPLRIAIADSQQGYPSQEGHSVVRRKIDRKKGRACGLCGEKKVKASSSLLVHKIYG